MGAGVSYPVRRAPAKLDRWGQLKGHLGLVLHMTEGSGTTADLEYLARNPARGVTVHFYANGDGTIYRMLDLDRISGSLNPADVAGASEDKGFYGRKNLKGVLGAHWQDPNSYVISMEIGGKAAKGPTDAQIKAITAWGLDMRRQFPSLRGALGHADCTDTKGCPGTSAAMKAIFAGIGGHGLFTTVAAPTSQEDDVIPFDLQGPTIGTFTYDNIPHHRLIGLDGKTLPIDLAAGYVRNIYAVAILAKPYGTGPGDRRTVYLAEYVGTPAFCLAADGTFVAKTEPPAPGPSETCPDPTDQIEAAVRPLETKIAAAMAALQ